MITACQHPTIQNMRVTRHNKFLQLIVNAWRKGSLGWCRLLTNAGKKYSTNNREEQTILAWMMPLDKIPTLEDGTRPNKPDFLIIKGMDQGMKFPPPHNGKKESISDHPIYSKWILSFVEGTFTWDTNWWQTINEKIEKYRLLMEILRSYGWKVEMRVVVAGVTGAPTTHSDRMYKQIGIDETGRHHLTKAIMLLTHRYAHQLVQTRKAIEKEIAPKHKGKLVGPSTRLANRYTGINNLLIKPKHLLLTGLSNKESAGTIRPSN
jgi:hypothetical protein